MQQIDPEFSAGYDMERGDEARPASVLDGLGVQLRAEFENAKNLRRYREEEWAKDLRDYEGEYGDDVLIQDGRSKAFIRLSRAKIKSIDARMTDMLFPAGDKNWSIEASPIPEIDPEVMRPEIEAILARDGQLDGEALLEAVREVAAERAAKMEEQIRDDLAAFNFTEEAREVLHSGHLFGTGILKGPFVVERTNRRYVRQPGLDGAPTFALEISTDLIPVGKAIPLWNAYPDPYARKPEECEFFWERNIAAKHEVRALSNDPRFDGDAIRQYLREHPEGDVHELTPFEYELLHASKEDDKGTKAHTRKYAILERWGYIDGKCLREAGIDVPEDMLDIEAEAVVWMLGNRVIRIAQPVLPQGSIPYKFYYFEKDPYSIWGRGVCSINRWPQQLFNASIRMMIDNGAITSGPQIEVNADLMEDEGDLTTLVPFRVWVRRGRGVEAQHPALRVYDLGSRTQEFMAMAKTFADLSDEVTALPKFTYGQPGAGASKTVGGLSMLMGQANIALKDNVKNWDEGITTPFISDFYHYEMNHGTNEDAKGDYQVVARGASSLIAKEVRSQALEQFAATTANPIDAPTIKRIELNRERAKALDLPSDAIVVSDEEVEEDLAKDQMIAALQGALQNVAAQIGVPVEQLLQDVAGPPPGMAPATPAAPVAPVPGNEMVMPA